MRTYIFTAFILLLFTCRLKTQGKIETGRSFLNDEYKTIGEIPAPAGFARLTVPGNSFGHWLRSVHLKKDKRVFLYNGLLKADQSVQYAVLNEKTGDKDLQQCADAIMRLRAEYFFSDNRYDSILFSATDRTELSFSKWRKGTRYQLSGNKLRPVVIKNVSNRTIHDEFENYLETVFRYAGTYSLASQLVRISLLDIQPGDVFIKPGFPGHAMIVADVCVNENGERLFMLAQGYMPAQDIHIVKNYADGKISPWYKGEENNALNTPEWIFNTNQLKRWK
jgi:hypothetical protein